MKPTISVIIPTYNRKKLVAEAIQSVMKQEPKNFEILVIDDGSIDGTYQYLQSLSLPIQLIKKENGGVSSARNLGIKKAQGEYIAFLDSDDIWLPGKLDAELKELIANPSFPLAYTDLYIEVDGIIQSKTKFQTSHSTPESRKRFYLPCFVQPVPLSPCGVLVRKKIFDELGGFREDLRLDEDLEMWNRVGQYYPEFGVIDKPYGVIRWEKDPEHLLKNDDIQLFISAGRKYLDIYEESHKSDGSLPNVQWAILESRNRLDILDKLAEDLREGRISAEYFNSKRWDIFIPPENI